jgi:hypothetical protein
LIALVALRRHGAEKPCRNPLWGLSGKDGGLEWSGCGWLAVAIDQILHVVGMRVDPPRLRVQATLRVTLSVDDGIGGKAVPAELMIISK